MREWADALGKALKSLLGAGTECDFTITCTNGEVRCHRIMLLGNGGRLASTVQDRLLDGVSRLDISRLDISKEVAKAILYALYGGIQDELTDKNAIHFIQFTYYFNIEWLMKEIIGKFKSILSPENVLSIYSQPAVLASTHLSAKTKTFCRENFNRILPIIDPISHSFETISMLLGQVPEDTNHHLLFRKMMEWINYEESHLKHVGNILTLLPLSRMSKHILQTDVYDVIFNQLLIEKTEHMVREDKILISNIYRRALNSAETHQQAPNKDKPLPARSGGSTSPHCSQLHELEVAATPTRVEVLSAPKVVSTPIPATPIPGDPHQRRIMEAVRKGEWCNMELDEVRCLLKRPRQSADEYVLIEAVLYWIATDRSRRQHAEQLLRLCRFISPIIIPLY